MLAVNLRHYRNVKHILTLLLCMLIYNSSYSQVKLYKLIDRTTGADIDQQKFAQLNKLGSGYHLLNKVFKPSKGNYTVYRFVAEYKGFSHRTEKSEVFHDLLILKTDNSSTILDAYQYTLEWNEMPFTYDLFRFSANGLKLSNQLKIGAFKFKQTDNGGSISHQFLNDPGSLLLSNDGKF